MLLRELFNRNLNEAEAPDYVDSLKSIDTTDSLWKRSKRGSVKSDEVKAIQQALNDLGYDAGAADGWFGRRTAAAVRKFQEDNNLTVDGDPGANTLSKMNDVVADKYPEEPEAGEVGDNTWLEGISDNAIRGEDKNNTMWAIDESNNLVAIANRDTPGTFIHFPIDSLSDNEFTADGAVYNVTMVKRFQDGEDQNVNNKTIKIRYKNSPNLLDRWIPLASDVSTPEELENGDEEPEATGSGRGDGNIEVAARREEAAKQATEDFVRSQVAELTRIRRNMPNDQLIRTVTQRAVEQGLNDGWRENGAMAAYIAELVPTVDRNDAAPEVGTAAPTLGQPSAGSDDSGPNIQSGDNAPVDTSAPARPQAPSMADRNIAAQKTAAQISAFQQAYGTGTDGQLPTLFRDRFLNPALDTLSLKTMKELSDELAGEIPQAVARVIVQRLEQTYGNTQELTQAAQEMRSDTDPEIRDQVQALDLLIPLITKLKQDAARNESVEIDRIRMLAGV